LYTPQQQRILKKLSVNSDAMKYGYRYMQLICLHLAAANDRGNNQPFN